MIPSMSSRRISVLLGVTLVGTGLAVAPAEAACAAAPRVSLAGFTLADGPRPFYLGDEGQDTTIRVRISGGCAQTIAVDWATANGTATAPGDYTAASGTDERFIANDEVEEIPHLIPINGPEDPPDAIVESVNVALNNPRITSGGGSVSMSDGSAPILIVDEDGANRVGFEGVPTSQSETFATARFAVFRAGPVAAPTSISYTVAPGPGTPATPGADFTVISPGVLDFQAGERFETIDLAVFNDKIGEGPEDVTITLSGTEVVEPSSTIFTIIDNEESVAPTSRFHHPRHTWRYKKSDYRIREFHVFATDNPGGAGVVAAEIALRRNLKNRTCAWLTLSGWQKKDCQNREWLPTTYDDVGELFYYRMKQLKSSVGTRIKDYTAFSRAIDGAENVEKEFTQKRNANTFEIKRARRRR
jgi:hypothetical protein